jgi:hypothetical protein
MNYIYNDAGAKIYVENSILIVELVKDTEYNEEKFDVFLEYFKNTWIYNKENNIKLYLKIQVISNDEKDVNVPISAYIKLVKILGDLHSIFQTNLHSLCIFTNDKKIQDVYNLLLKFYNPPDKRPITFTDSIDEMTKFFKINKLID